MIAPKQVGIWIRVSTEDQAQGESPANHEQRARYYAEAKGWEATKLYDLSGVSGKSVAEHPEAKRMMADVRDGSISGLIFSKLARLARNTKELLDFAEFFREQDADLISLQEAIDTSSPAGRLFYTMIAAMAQWEREEIAERVAAAIPIRARLGKPIGGQPCFGYHWRDGVLTPHPEEAPVRKLIYELFLEHKRKKTVARILNERGYRTRKGAAFSDTTITRLITDSTAKGIHRANYTTSKGRGKAAVLKPEEDWVLRSVEPIVSEDLWDACNAIIADQRARAPVRRKTIGLFSGIAFCQCGSKMYPKTGAGKYICPSCRNKIPVDDLEALFHQQLQNFFLSDEQIRECLAQASEQISSLREEIVTLTAERGKLAGEMDKVYRLYTDDALQPKAFGDLYQPMCDRRDQIDERLLQAQAKIDVLEIDQESSEEVVVGARDLYSRWDKLGRDEKRAIIEAITESIVIGETEIEINLHFVPSEESGKKATRQHTHVAFFPNLPWSLRHVRSPDWPQNPRTLREYLLWKRKKSGLRQIDAAAQLCVSTWTYRDWEQGASSPSIRHWPNVIAYLGFDPTPQATSFAERLHCLRRRTGQSASALGLKYGLDERTILRFEAGKGNLNDPRVKAAVDQILAALVSLGI